MSEWHIERIIGNTINDTARGDPDALAARIVAALAEAGYSIAVTEDAAPGSQLFDALPALAASPMELEPTFRSRLFFKAGIVPVIVDGLAEGARLLGLLE
jgi:hypothetical protein